MKRCVLFLALFFSVANSAQVLGPADGFPLDPVISLAYHEGTLYLGTQGSGVYELQRGRILPSEKYAAFSHSTIYSFTKADSLIPNTEGTISAYASEYVDFGNASVHYRIGKEGLVITYGDAAHQNSDQSSNIWHLSGIVDGGLPDELVVLREGKKLHMHRMDGSLIDEFTLGGVLLDLAVYKGQLWFSMELGLVKYDRGFRSVSASLPVLKFEDTQVRTPLGRIGFDRLLKGNWTPADFTPIALETTAANDVYDIDTIGQTYYSLSAAGITVSDTTGPLFVLGPERGIPPHRPSYLDVLQWGDELYIATKMGAWSFADLGSPSQVHEAELQLLANGLEVSNFAHLDPEPATLAFTATYQKVGAAPVHGRYRLNAGPWQSFTPANTVVLERPAPGKIHLEVELSSQLNFAHAHAFDYDFNIRARWYKRPWIWVVLVLLGAAVVVVGQRRARLRIAEKLDLQERLAEAELASKRLQMNPHFLFNALDAISNFIFTNQPKEAVNYMGKLAKLMRLTLDGTRSATMVLADEIDLLEKYLDLAQLRYGDFERTIAVDPELDMYEVQVPPMILQPLVENAIQYAMRPMINTGDQGRIVMKFSPSAEGLLVEIEDNGPGFDAALRLSSSHGLSIIEERLELLTKKNKRPYSMQISSTTAPHSPTGTKVSLILGTELEL